MEQKRPKIIVIVGPTAVGKTSASVELAMRIGGEVISADSRQAYCGLDIGTGKVTTDEMRGIPHHLLDVVKPTERFTVADFVRLGREKILEISARGNIPLVVGGTGFYVDALVGRASIPEVKPNSKLREKLVDVSNEKLFEMLKDLDANRAENIDSKNRVRLIRAIEIATELGAVPETQLSDLYDVLWIGLTLENGALHERIHTRLIERMSAGMVQEARDLHESGLTYERMEELGLEYRYMARHLEGKLTETEMLVELEKEIKHYAKRQMAWFKRNADIQWFPPSEENKIITLVNAFLN